MFSFDGPLKLALCTLENNNKISIKQKKTVTIQCVLPTRPSQDGKCHWSVLKN